jgi:exoribonuclease R
LITQRLLKAVRTDDKPPYRTDELLSLAAHCTGQEDAAAKVERRVRKSAAAQVLSGRIGATFDAIVTGAADKGTWVRLLAPPAEGKLVRGYEGAKVGDHFRVQLVSVNVDHGFIDFARAAK